MAIGRWDLGAPPGGEVAAERRGPGLEEGRPLDLGQRAKLGQGGGALDLRDPVVLGGGQTDPEVQAQGLRQLLAKGGPDRASVDAAEDLPGDVAVEHRVVARGRSWRPQRRHGGDPCGDRLPVVPEFDLHRLGECGQAVLVREALADGDVLLSGIREFRPDLGHPLAVVEPSLAHQPRQHEGGHRLGGGEHRRQGVGAEGNGPVAVGPAGHQVDDHLPLDGDGKAGAELGPFGEVGDEGVADGPESVGADTPDLRGLRHLSRGVRSERWARPP